MRNEKERLWRTVLIQPRHRPGFDKFETNLGNVLRLIKLSKNKKELIKYVENNGSRYINLDYIAKTFISVMTGIEIPENKEGGYNMLQAFAEIHEELEVAGRKVEFAESQLQAFKKKSEDLELENENVKHEINTLIESLRERGFTDEDIQSMLKK